MCIFVPEPTTFWRCRLSLPARPPKTQGSRFLMRRILVVTKTVVMVIGGMAFASFPHIAASDTSENTSNNQCVGKISNPESENQQIKCINGDGVGNIDIELNNYITTTSKNSIDALQKGLANINITVRGGRIESEGVNARAIQGFFDRTIPSGLLYKRDKAREWPKPGPGQVTIKLRDAEVSSNGDHSHAVHGAHRGKGELLIDVDLGDVRATGNFAYGISGFAGRNWGSNRVITKHISDERSNIRIVVRDSDILINGDRPKGIYAQHSNIGDITIRVVGGQIETYGEYGRAVMALHQNTTARNNLGYARNEGKVIVFIEDVTIRTEGANSSGVRGRNSSGVGPVEITVEGGTVTTKGAETIGVIGRHWANGSVDITIKGGSIVTEGESSQGVRAETAHIGTNTPPDVSGPVTARVLAGASIQAKGDTSIGIQMRNMVGDPMFAEVGETASVEASGVGSNGVQFGKFSEDKGWIDAADVGEDLHRRQTIRIDGSVQGGSGDGAAVVMAGGGKVIIGPQGRVGAASGVAIRAPVVSSPQQSRLLVDVTTGCRKMSEIIEGKIVSDGGTDLSVNGVTLHAASGGQASASAPNCARDVTVTRTLNSATGVPEFSFGDAYAPRAAIYEALPSLVQWLGHVSSVGQDDTETTDRVLNFSASGQGGSYVAKSATIGAHYDWRSRSLDARFAVPLTGSLLGRAGAQLINGHADVSAKTGGGRIEVSGSRVHVGAQWQAAASTYIRGDALVAQYGLEMSSATRGRLVSTVSAGAIMGRLEAGRSLAQLSGRIEHGLVRAWLHGGRVAIDGFTDRTGTRVAPAGHTHMAIGVGASLATPSNIAGIEGLSLHGDLGVEHALSGAQTTMVIVGQLPGMSERLNSRIRRSRILFGVGAMWRKGHARIEATMHGAATHRRDISLDGRITLRLAFS